MIVTARWILVLAGLLLALWNPAPVGQLRVEIVVILLLAVANFYLHAQLLIHRPVVDLVAYAASAADLVVISLLVASTGGVGSSLFIFYFPAILGFAVAFPTALTFIFAGSAMTLYALLSLDAGPLPDADARTLVTRLLMLAAVAVCGNVYWRIEAGRRRADAEAGAATSEARTVAQEAAEDIFFGQVVIIWARWFVILTAAILALWTATTASELSVEILLVVGLMAVNFFLHGRYLVQQPANQTLTTLASAVDLLIISAIALVWQGQQGLNSPYFVLYYPMLLAFAFVFQRRAAVAYTFVALAAYVVVCLLVDASFLGNPSDVKLLVMRLITLATVGVLGTFYWRIERDRRRAAAGGPGPGSEPGARLKPAVG